MLEVTLFLAISSLLALIAFAGLGPRLRNARFTDSVRGLESNVSRAISSSQIGEHNNTQACENQGGKAKLIDRPSASVESGMSEDCVNGGLWVYFKNDSVEYYQLPLLRKRVCDQAKVISNAIDVAVCFGFQPFDPESTSPASSYTLTNGLKQKSDQDTFIGYVVNPEDNKRYLFVEGEESSPSKKVCYALNGRVASMNFSSRSIEPKMMFNDKECA